MKEKNNIYNIEDYKATAKLIKNSENSRRLSELNELKLQIAETLVILAGSGAATIGSFIALISIDDLSIGSNILLGAAMAAGAIGTIFSGVALFDEALEIYSIYDYLNEQGIDVNNINKPKTLIKSKEKEKN